MPNKNPNELPPIEGELTDEDLKQVSGGQGPGVTNGGGVPPFVNPGQGPNTVTQPPVGGP